VIRAKTLQFEHPSNLRRRCPYRPEAVVRHTLGPWQGRRDFR
jgi:hypothetical protein